MANIFEAANFWLTKSLTLARLALMRLTGVRRRKVKGVLMPLDAEIGYDTLRWILNGKYEEEEAAIIESYLVKGEKVLEIGTGLGFITVLCARRTGSERVYSFEANPQNVDTAGEVFKMNNVSPAIEHAVIDFGNEDASFSVQKNRLASSLYVDGTPVEVARLPLNEVVSRISPDFLVMDIEGAEHSVVTHIDFGTIKKIQFELHPHLLSANQANEIFLTLGKNGFKKLHESKSGRNYFFAKD